MINKVILTSWTSFDVYLDKADSVSFVLFLDDKEINCYQIKIDKNIISYKFDEGIEVLGHELKIKVNESFYHIDVKPVIDFKEFDDLYTYNGDDLGAVYSKEYTSFKLWAPLASKAYVIFDGLKHQMSRLTSGVYNFTAEGDLDGKLYVYEIVINGETITSIDPYGLSSNANAKMSAVINKEKTSINMHDECLPKMNSYLDAIIYEANVRDMTIDPSTNIVNKGKYLGLIEENRKTSGGHVAGFDYLKSLGFTHLQLLPVLDFATVDELNPSKSYNWGYDPQQYFALEGSYSLNSNDPYSRILEFKKMVSEFHKAGIRINLDVVYNHIYKVETSTLEKLVPGYYFRRDKNGKFLDHSFCGNEIASERPMARKLILDSIRNLIEEYHVDGLRFDLMGLIDINTMNQVEQMVHKMKPDAMIYGEGWNMFSKTSDGSDFATMENASLLPNIAFFNDRYRNIVRGAGDKAHLKEPGYMLGSLNYQNGFVFAYFGAAKNYCYPPLFSNQSQSINYVECHDNATLFDVIKSTTEIEDELRLVRKINKLLMLSFGIPFIHAGQEIGLSKFNHHNTYNKGDKYNKFDYKLLDERYNMAVTMTSYIEARKEIGVFSNESSESVKVRSESGVTIIELNEKYVLIVNPSDKPFTYSGADFKFFTPTKFNKGNVEYKLNSIDIAPHQVSLLSRF